MDLATLRAWWAHRQGLDDAYEGKSAADVLACTGWARSVGGAAPYLTLFARAGLSREAADQSVADLAICELPSVRGCTYVIPAADFGLALKVGEGFSTKQELKQACALGSSIKEIDRLCDKVIDALAEGPLEPKELREHLGSAVREFGPEGVKKGLATTLPVALGKLQEEGRIRRIATNGRLDQQRYRYIRWDPNPLAGFPLSAEEAQTELARRYFTWIAPATLAEFQWFSALGVKAAKAATAPLGLVPLAEGDARLIFPADLDQLRAFKLPKKPAYTLTGSIDGIVLLRRALAELVDGDHPLLAGQTDLPSHPIFDRGRLVGLWEYDVPTESIAWTAFVPQDATLKKSVARTEDYVRSQLGDARSFSLDSPKSRAPRIAALRAS
uniref:Winged helix DNA-binding domain-containing protein n=1 Tax=Solibacter usitatus (strain Ellin6076) TaxID=234267 RepID=Q020L7_SOLUE